VNLLGCLLALALASGCDQLDSLMSSGEGETEGESETGMTETTDNPPSMTETTMVEPAMVEPAMVEPAMVEVAMVEPVMEEPVMEEPTMGEPTDTNNPLIVCRTQADPDQCIIDALAGRTRYAEQMVALVAAYQHKGRSGQAVPIMQDFLRRFPTHNAAERFRQQLLRQGIQPAR
jgi:hypothetical protein